MHSWTLSAFRLQDSEPVPFLDVLLSVGEIYCSRAGFVRRDTYPVCAEALRKLVVNVFTRLHDKRVVGLPRLIPEKVYLDSKGAGGVRVVSEMNHLVFKARH